MKRILPLILTCLILGGLLVLPAAGAADGTALVNTFSAAPEMGTSAESVLVVDRDSGLPLYEKNATARIYPASTTKLMTALCAAEKVKDLDAAVTVRQDVLDQLPDDDNSLAGLQAGEELTMRQLLYSLMLPSGNDAALVVADYVSGSESAFAQLMNQRAAELGCTDTVFVNPHGLAGQEQYSTAWDLARIAEAYLRVPALAEIAAAKEYTFSTNMRDEVTVKNSNLLLDPESELYEPSARGVKTGTQSLGASFVSAAEQDGLRILCVAAGVPAKNEEGYLITPNPALAEGRKFLAWANSSFARVTLFDDQTRIPVVLEGLGRNAYATVGGPVTAVLPKDQAGQVTQEVSVTPGLKAPLAAGAVVGAITWYCSGVPVAESMPLVLARGVSAVPTWLWAAMWTVLILLAACSVILRRRQKQRRQQRRARRRAPVPASGAAKSDWGNSPEWMKEVLDDDQWL